MRTILRENVKIPYSLHDMTITAFEICGNDLIVRTEPGIIRTSSPSGCIKGHAAFEAIQWDFSYAYIWEHTGNTGRSPDDWLALVGIDPEDRHRLMRGYSHGMKNKVQMLCFLIGRPPVILLDEPLTSFDVVAALEMKNLLREMKDDHIIIFSTHILQLAADLCDEIVILNHGKLEGVDSALIGTPEFETRIIDILRDADHGEAAQ